MTTHTLCGIGVQFRASYLRGQHRAAESLPQLSQPDLELEFSFVLSCFVFLKTQASRSGIICILIKSSFSSLCTTSRIIQTRGLL